MIRKADEIRDRIINLARDEESGWEPVPSDYTRINAMRAARKAGRR